MYAAVSSEQICPWRGHCYQYLYNKFASMGRGRDLKPHCVFLNLTRGQWTLSLANLSLFFICRLVKMGLFLATQHLKLRSRLRTRCTVLKLASDNKIGFCFFSCCAVIRGFLSNCLLRMFKVSWAILRGLPGHLTGGGSLLNPDSLNILFHLCTVRSVIPVKSEISLFV